MNAQRRPSIDPAVADLLSGMESRQAERKLPRKEQERKAKERVRIKRRNRVMLDLPPDLEKRIVDLAASLECPISQAAAALLVIGINALNATSADGFDLTDYRKPSKSPRYSYILDIQEIEINTR